MATCPNGHSTQQTDFCDVCGLPVTQVPAAPGVPEAAKTLVCPQCHTANVPLALFCEACGYDFITGQMQANPWAPPRTPEQTAAAAMTPGAPGISAAPLAPPAPFIPAAPGAQAPAAPAPAAPPPAPKALVQWVAELWVDPDWYAMQGSPDQMPSAGLPDIVPLVNETNLIGRTSMSRNIFPEVDCELDSGCSRRHALLTTDWSRWWVEDLDSANGTFVGDAAGPVPSMPIPRGRVELTPGQRVYVGAWTRIVVRRATPDEQQAFAG